MARRIHPPPHLLPVILRSNLLQKESAPAVAAVAAAIPDLAAKPDQSVVAGDGVTVAGRAVTLAAADAPGPANVAWLSDLRVDGTLSSLTVYNGPLTGVPHLVSRCVVVGDALRFFLDFRPRSYGAYDLRDGDGRYPGPETLRRKGEAATLASGVVAHRAIAANAHVGARPRAGRTSTPLARRRWRLF